MAVRLNISESLRRSENESSEHIHSIPCKILTDGEANVTGYFSNFVEEREDGILEVTFRGRPFQGTIINLPDSVRGYVFQEPLKPVSGKEDRVLHATHSFKSFKFWNWDKIPSKNDPIMGALDWLDISTALHSPLKIESEPKENGCNDEVKS